jgi:acyl transferase domain-containing protein
MLATNV